MLTLLLSSIALAAPCDQPVSPAQLGARVDDAMLSWATLDEDGFATIAEQVKADVTRFLNELHGKDEQCAYNMAAGDTSGFMPITHDAYKGIIAVRQAVQGN